MSFVSEALFKSKLDRRLSGEKPCHNTSHNGFRRMFGGLETATATTDNGTRPQIHPGPSSSSSSLLSSTENEHPSLNSVQSVFRTLTTNDQFHQTRRQDLIRCKVVSEQDANRGFRLFDGILMSVKDVSSEELFLERMRIVYSYYDTFVAGSVNRSPLEIAKALVRALSACLKNYFSTQSMLRANRPFIAKVLNLDCPDMFCSHSDFAQTFLFTNASPEDEAIISMAEKVYAENDFDVCTARVSRRRSGVDDDGSATKSDRDPAAFAQQLFDIGTRIAERNVLGGNRPSFATKQSYLSDINNKTSNDTVRNAHQTERATDATAMLIVVTDLEALHNYVAYVLYLTPAQLTRRYNVNFDCLRRPASNMSLDCCREREASKRKRDSAKVAIRTIIEKKRRDKIDSMRERDTTCEGIFQERVAQTIERNNDLLCHLLLMMFDKCLSATLDRGFENLNSRRGYAVNSAKEIGSATVYTGIIDTVGEVSTIMEGCTFENIAKSSPGDVNNETDGTQHRLHFSVPINNIVREMANEHETIVVDEEANSENQ